jgi:hypothetical protein
MLHLEEEVAGIPKTSWELGVGDWRFRGGHYFVDPPYR